MTTENDVKNQAAKNKEIYELFKYTMVGVIAADAGSRQPQIVAKVAMELAKAAYACRVEHLGLTFCKGDGNGS